MEMKEPGEKFQYKDLCIFYQKSLYSQMYLKEDHTFVSLIGLGCVVRKYTRICTASVSPKKFNVSSIVKPLAFLVYTLPLQALLTPSHRYLEL